MLVDFTEHWTYSATASVSDLRWLGWMDGNDRQHNLAFHPSPFHSQFVAMLPCSLLLTSWISAILRYISTYVWMNPCEHMRDWDFSCDGRYANGAAAVGVGQEADGMGLIQNLPKRGKAAAAAGITQESRRPTVSNCSLSAFWLCEREEHELEAYIS